MKRSGSEPSESCVVVLLLLTLKGAGYVNSNPKYYERARRGEAREIGRKHIHHHIQYKHFQFHCTTLKATPPCHLQVVSFCPASSNAGDHAIVAHNKEISPTVVESLLTSMALELWKLARIKLAS